MTEKKTSTYSQKIPHTYTYRKCEHNSTHVERSVGGPYKVCNACNTIRENLNPKNARTPREREVLKAA